MLAIYGYGTNIGIRGVAAGDHGHSEDDLRYVRRRFLTAELVRSLAIEIANATFAARDPGIWGQTSTTVALGLQAHRRARPEPADRVARPLPQAGRADLLARGEEVGGDPLAADLAAPRWRWRR